MFDKNRFKESFRSWMEENPLATYSQACKACANLLPSQSEKEYAWLVEESLAWFLWRQEIRQKDRVRNQIFFV